MTFESLDRIFGTVFIRTHCSYAVNVMHIADLRADSVILKNRQAIPLSRSCADGVKKMWGSILYG
jgi:DNA-binding LytR/AlgR family response regulator